MDINRIFRISSADQFESLALEIFRYQYKNTLAYREFCELLGIEPESISSIEKIPFLPIEIFKQREVKVQNRGTEVCFESSGTTSSQSSKHFVADLDIYRTSFRETFKKFYGNISNYCVLALLPSYLERQNSSLIYMVQDLIDQSGHSASGFYLDNLEELAHTLTRLEDLETPTILIGVSFALLDMAKKFPMPLRYTTIMETGGMKGRRKEMIRAELHGVLKEAWGIKQVHSEYGMTELLSQAYSQHSGIFHTPRWMRILIRDTEDPIHYLGPGSTGGVNIVDLANVYSCSFIATQDLGKLRKGGGFEVLGRFDHSDIRGCNLMMI